MTDLTLDVGQANELKLAFRKHGYTNEDIKRLTEGHVLAQVLDVLKGFHTITRISGPSINCDLDPRIPVDCEELRNFRIKSHRRHGQLVWEPRILRAVFPSPEGREESYWTTSSGERLLMLLGTKPVLNACVKDFLLANPQLIPHEWFRPHQENFFGDRTLYFFGTIFRDEKRKDWVSGLQKRDGIVSEVLMPMKGGYYADSISAIMLGPWSRETR